MRTPMNLYSDREADAIELLRQYEPVRGYYLSFSGGKDSVVLDHIAMRAGVKYERHFANTTVEAPETYNFIHQYYPDTIWDKPRMTMRAAIILNQYPPTRIVRYCCEELKECHGQGRLLLTGIRKKESTARGKRKQIEVDYKTNNKIFINPLFDWSTAEIWDYIKECNLPVNPLYAEGRTRIGCVMCPMSGSTGMQRDALRWPWIAKRYQGYIQEMWDYWTHIRGKKYKDWTSPMDIYNWWITETPKKPLQEEDLFEESK
jgi:phosphoadenosine phosphosulfate reductase